MAPIRAIGDPIVDLLASSPTPRCSPISTTAEPKGHHYYWKTDYVAELSDELLDRQQGPVRRLPNPGCRAGLPAHRRGLNEHDEDDGAVGNRDARYMIGANAMWEPDEPERGHVPPVDPRCLGALASLLYRPHLHQLPDRRRGRRSASGRRTVPTSTASSRSRRSTTPTTCSVQTEISRIGSRLARQSRISQSDLHDVRKVASECTTQARSRGLPPALPCIPVLADVWK